MIVEQEGCEILAQVPLDVVGEHAEEDVGSDAVRSSVVDGADLEVHRFEASEGAFDPGEVLVGADGASGVEALGLDIGADDVDAVELFFGGDLLVEAFEGEGVLGDLGVEVLGDLVSVDDLSDADADSVLAAEGPLGAPGGLSAMGSRSFSVASRSASRLRRRSAASRRIAADDEPFPGEVVAGDFGEVPLVEQGGADGFVGDEFPDGGGAQGGDPAQSPRRGARSSRMRAEVSMPRSPTRTRRARPKRSRSLSTWVATVFGSLVLPSKTSTAMGQPSGEHSSPKTIWSLSFLPSRL